MASTFRRKRNGATAVQPPGTKAWTAGSILVSTGLRELDAILGAGQTLGSCIYLEEEQDKHSLANCLTRYWCAEALVQAQDLLVPVAVHCSHCKNDLGAATSWNDFVEDGVTSCSTDAGVQRLLGSLPRSLHEDKQNVCSEKETATPNQGLETLVEEEEDVEDGLVVAWQYRKDVQQERLGLGEATSTSSATSSHSSVFCHSFDLQGRLSDQLDVTRSTTLAPMGLCPTCCHGHPRTCGFRYARELVERVESMLAAQTRKTVLRLLFLHQKASFLTVALPVFMNHVRQKNLPVVVLVVHESGGLWNPVQHQLQRSSDVVLETESFVSRAVYPPPPEFRDFLGLLKVRKASTCTSATSAGHFADMTVQKRPSASVYGLKRDRRKLHISLLHIPPEDYAADGGSVAGGAVRSGAGRSSSSTVGGCASAGGNSPIDF